MGVRGTGRAWRRGPVWWVEVGGKRFSTGIRGEPDKKGNPPVGVEMYRAQKLVELGRGELIQSHATFEDLSSALITLYTAENRAPSLRTATLRLKQLKKTFGGLPLKQITEHMVRAYAVKRRDQDGAAVASINLELAYLSRGFDLLKHQHPNPPRIRRLPGTNVRQGFLEQEALDQITSRLRPEIRVLVRFLALTGWRISEALGLTWDRVDLDTCEIRLKTSKNGQPRVVAFKGYEDLKELLEERRGDAERMQLAGRIVPWVFHLEGSPLTYVSAYDNWRTARMRAGYPKAMFHDLRRTIVRKFENARVPRSVAMSITGHTSEAIYRRYAISAPADQIAALKSISKSSAPSKIVGFARRGKNNA